MRVINTAYTKKEALAMIDQTMDDDDVLVISTAVKEVNTSKKSKLFTMKTQFSHEIIKDPEDVRSWVDGHVTGSIIIFKDPNKKLSDEWNDGLKNGDGVFGFSIDNSK